MAKTKGEYYADLDEATGYYCIFHTDIGEGKAFESYTSKEEAERRTKTKNQGGN